MRFPKRALWIAASALVLVALACGGSITTANFKNAYLSADSDGAQQTTVFSQDQIFYCIAELQNAPDDTKVRGEWIAVQVEGVDPNFVIDSSEIVSGDDTLTFNLSNTQLWPVGQYRVDLYIDDKLETSLDFEVR